MGSRISAVLRAKEQTGSRVREGRYAKLLSVMGDATPTQFPSCNPQNGAACAGDQPQSERGAHSNLALARNGSAAKNCKFLSLERDRSRTWTF
jgi:hypothetical protein